MFESRKCTLEILTKHLGTLIVLKRALDKLDAYTVLIQQPLYTSD